MICNTDLFNNSIICSGNISGRCEVISEGNTKYIVLDGGFRFQYEVNDTVSKRMIWAEVYEKGFVTYKQASKGAGVTNTTVKNWVKRYREEGLAGLQDKVGRGAVKKLSDNDIRMIFELRESRKTMNEIARICNCSNAIVCKILNAQKANREESPALDLEFEEKNQHEALSEDVLTEDVLIEETLIEKVSTEEGGIEFPFEGLLDDKVEALRAKSRDNDRTLAAAGKLYDATPYFAPGKQIEYAGIFMAFVILAQDAYLKVGLKIFKNIGPAFYGLRTTLLTLITLALLRIKRPEHLLNDNPEKLGAVLGLDRVLSVKTCRRKIEKLSQPVPTIKFMEEMGYHRFSEFNGEAKIIMVDGHTDGYFGEKKVGSTWSSRDNKVIKAHTENWINLPGKAPLFSFETNFNNGLVSSLESVLNKTKNALKTESLTCVFDRGGASALLFEKLTQQGYGLITYQKGDYNKIKEEKFSKEKIVLGVREYNCLPFEQEIILDIYEVKDNGYNKRPGSKKTGRTIKMRDIRILCDDGHQVSILSNSNVQISAIEIADVMFQRIGSLENVFKYMREEFDVDGLVSCKFENVDESIEHPNPKWIKQEKKIKKLKKEQNINLIKLSKLLFFEESKSIFETINYFSDSKTISLLDIINLSKEKLTKKAAVKLFDGFEVTLKIKEHFALKIFNKIKMSNIKTSEEVKNILKEIIKTKVSVNLRPLFNKKRQLY